MNADGYLSTGQSVIGTNVFAYCGNSPILQYDPSGRFAFVIPIAVSAPAWVPTVIAGLAAVGTAAVIILADLNPFSAEDRSNFGISYAETDVKLPNQGEVSEIPDAPPVDAGKQGKHIPGHNNNDPTKSQWLEGETGVKQTQEGWKNGNPDPKVSDGSVRIGQSEGKDVRVHIDKKGRIHGYPLEPFKWS